MHSGMTATGEKQKAEIVSSCASLFDMENSKDIFIFNQWLVRLDDFESVLKYLPASKSKMDENLLS